MPIVVDASAIVPLALDGEDREHAEAVLLEIVAEGGVIPAIFWYEIRNVLLLNEPRGRSEPERTAQFLADVEALPLTVDFPPASGVVMHLARRHSLTVYDAAYLELTLRTNSRLASHDRPLRTAVLAEGGAIFQG